MAIDQQELARRLRKLRESCNMTQVAVAKHLGVARSAVTEIETGRRSSPICTHAILRNF